MKYLDIAGHELTYLAVIIGIFYIIVLTVIIMRKSWKRALVIGYSKEQVWRIVKISASYSLIPAIAILVGFFTLVPILGIPLSWWRLSVIGNTSYEIMAANMAMNTVGVSDVFNASANEFILIMYVMAIGIMGGMVISLILAKSIQKGTFRLRNIDRRWSALGASSYMVTILIVFIIPICFSFSVSLLTFLTSAAMMIIMKCLIDRFNMAWLTEFALTISMLAAMISSVLWNRLFISFG
jgi:hypothetical protein